MHTCAPPPECIAKFGSELRVADGAGIGEDVADVGDTGEVHNHTLKTKPEACVRRSAVLAQV